MKTKFKIGDYVVVVGPPKGTAHMFWNYSKEKNIGMVFMIDEISYFTEDKNGKNPICWKNGSYAYMANWLRPATPEEALTYLLDKSTGGNSDG